jgi:CDP-paratose 2-epimerase
MAKEIILITGGAGFIGSNIAVHFLNLGHEVNIIDNFSRKGSRQIAKWLKTKFLNCTIFKGDIVHNRKLLSQLVSKVDIVFHMAAQVAVTTSVLNPRKDFEVNVLGTINLLEAIRESQSKPILIFASTNKVYGNMDFTDTKLESNRYMYADIPLGISEYYPLDFHSPYGCSKGSADQYIRDYSRIYGLKSIVFRQSCIYGERQFGIEDQGWVAWFSIAAIFKKQITIYGDGRQVRDVLHVTDLINAYELSIKNIESTSGQIYNIGGGPNNTLSLLELLDILKNILQENIPVNYSSWRPGDQRVYISSIGKLSKDLGWSPKIKSIDGINQLCHWVYQNKKLILSSGIL